MAPDLKNKPLVEAILEVRWKLQSVASFPKTDPHYKLLLGRLFDRISKDYPEHEQLQTANIPDEFVAYSVQHRFRVGKKAWPLIQIGPGIFTINSADEYKWSTDFKPRVLSAVAKLYEAHPKVEDLKISNLILRYINAVPFDYKQKNLFEFLNENLRINISIPGGLFENSGVDSKPNSFIYQSSFQCEKPKGIINIRMATGQKSNIPALVWEITVESADDDVPQMPQGFESWLVSAHDDLIDDWFFKMIEGKLLRRFSDG